MEFRSISYSGVGTPNGFVVGDIGDLYTNTAGGVGNTLWVKETGSGTNTGWSLFSGGGSPGAVLSISFPIGIVTVSSATSIPAGAIVLDTSVNITTAYSASANISVGQGAPGPTTLLQGTADNSPTVVNTYEAPQVTSWGASALAVTATITGTPTAGAGTVTVTYTLANP